MLKTRAVNDSHTSAYVAELLNNVAEDWQITKKDLVLFTDNVSNRVVAAEQFLHVKCYALMLPTVSRLMGRVRRPTMLFHRSTTAKHQLEEKHKLLGLPRHKLETDMSTRWNSDSYAEDIIKALKPMKDPTTLVTEERAAPPSV